MMLRTSPLCAALVLGAAACGNTNGGAPKDTAATATPSAAGATIDTAAVRQFIEGQEAKYATAADKADTATILADYAEDAVYIRPNQAAARGRGAIGRAYGEMYAQLDMKGNVAHTDEVTFSGDIAVETGTYALTFQPKSGGRETRETGKYLVIWKRQPDGSWKIFRDIATPDDKPSGT